MKKKSSAKWFVIMWLIAMYCLVWAAYKDTPVDELPMLIYWLIG